MNKKIYQKILMIENKKRGDNNKNKDGKKDNTKEESKK